MLSTNKHIPLKNMIIQTTWEAVSCFSNVAHVIYSTVTSRLHVHFHLLLLRWWNLYKHHTNQLARKVRRLYEDLKLYYDRFSSRNGPGIFQNSANNRESWSRKSDCVTLGELEDDMLSHTRRKNSLDFQSAFCTHSAVCSGLIRYFRSFPRQYSSFLL